MSVENTIDYYNSNAEKFVEGTVSVELETLQNKFINKLKGNSILDFGCGSGRDTKYFLDRGFVVEAIDGSLELCKIASEYTGINVRNSYFQDLNEVNKYNGIWACASILHLPYKELEAVFNKMAKALKTDGIIYTSFKYGDFEGERNERYFTDMTESSFEELIKGIKELHIEEEWVTADVRPGRDQEKWLNLILRRIN